MVGSLGVRARRTAASAEGGRGREANRIVPAKGTPQYRPSNPHVSPCRGAQGNALKTIVAMPFALDPDAGVRHEIAARGVRHEIALRVARLRQQPVPSHDQRPDEKGMRSWAEGAKRTASGAAGVSPGLASPVG